MQVTIRFAEGTTAYDSAQRAMGCVLLQTEAATAQILLSGFCFDTKRKPQEIFNDFYAEGFDDEDFASVEFEFNR